MNSRILASMATSIAVTLLVCMSVLQAAPPTKVTVTDADPDSALQGEMLPVEISGDGFDDGSTVRFLVTGSQDDDEIEVQAVEFLTPKKLRAHIRVKDDATVVDYDIEVRSAGGRRGKGTGLFSVQSSAGAVPVNVIDAGWFGGSGAEELIGPRECVPVDQLNPDAGHYHCDNTGVVQFNLSGGILTSKKGSQAWCNNFNVQITANTQYRVYWTGDCLAGNCTLSLLNSSVDTHDVNQANGWPEDVGLLIIKANGEIEGPSSTVNPYIDLQVFDIEEFTVDFNQLGSNRKLASCLFLPDPGEVVFVSTPQ